MVEHLDAPLDLVFRALGDPTRRKMLVRLAESEQTVGDLAAPFDITFAAVSKHVKVLEQAGLVHRSRRGRQQVCRLEPGPLAEAQAWMKFYERFWTERLDALEKALDKDAAADAAPKRRSRS